jgi:hypothetical protein
MIYIQLKYEYKHMCSSLETEVHIGHKLHKDLKLITWLGQNEMESITNSNNLNSTEEEIVSQVLRGHISGHV